jgi:2OG-Fe(II) oxygenase superfamily
MILNTSPTQYAFFEPRLATRGSEFHGKYTSAEPFPHIVLDDFLDENTIRLCLSEFPEAKGPETVGYSRKQESGKFEYRPESLSAPLRALLYSFNSLPFILFLESLTGIRGLIPDPYFLGGGLHEMVEGGRLNIHADFNHHPQMNLERRVNVLIYLNREWKEEYGGCLDLWDTKMRSRRARIVPVLNRCVIFNTSIDSFHGNPEPIHHPEGISRRSIALYYYTSTWDDSRRSRSTQFQVRPLSQDAIDYQVRATELIEEVIPPIFLRTIRRLVRRMKPSARTKLPRSTVG